MTEIYIASAGRIQQGDFMDILGKRYYFVHTIGEFYKWVSPDGSTYLFCQEAIDNNLQAGIIKRPCYATLVKAPKPEKAP